MKYSVLYIILLFIYTSISGLENGKYELESISFVGNSSFSDAELISIISLRESPNSISQFLNDLIGLGEEAIYFDSLSLQEEESRLKSYYFNNGFFDVNISSTFFFKERHFSSRVKTSSTHLVFSVSFLCPKLFFTTSGFSRMNFMLNIFKLRGYLFI